MRDFSQRSQLQIGCVPSVRRTHTVFRGLKRLRVRLDRALKPSMMAMVVSVRTTDRVRPRAAGSTAWAALVVIDTAQDLFFRIHQLRHVRASVDDASVEYASRVRAAGRERSSG